MAKQQAPLTRPAEAAADSDRGNVTQTRVCTLCLILFKNDAKPQKRLEIDGCMNRGWLH